MEQKYITIYTRNAKRMKLYGDKLTWVEKFINVRSNGLHMELRFSDRYGGISASSTLQDGVNGFRFKMIGYSHGYRWDKIRIPVTAEQEKQIFIKACEMADVPYLYFNTHLKTETNQNISENFYQNGCYYGNYHIKYDRRGVMYSFITGWRLWKPSNKKNWCNESVALLLMEVWADLLLASPTADWDISDKKQKLLEPHDLLPDQTHYMIANYIDSIIEDVKGNSNE
jgi:hypothetical protein